MTHDEPETRESGEPFYKLVCECIRCGKLVTNPKSVKRKAGPKCYEHLHGQTMHQRLEREHGQLNWLAEGA